MKRINIALDGPVGAGKSTVADAVAEKLGILHLDTGAMYRALGVYLLDQGVDPDDRKAAEAAAAQVAIRVSHEKDGQHTYVEEEDVTGRIRTEAVSRAASRIATYPGVRRAMVAKQQALAAEHDMLVDGRDIGTRVLPDATLKIYLTASDEVRAQRRFLQMQEKGETPVFEEVLEDLRKRDYQDMHRETDPLMIADGAIVVDTSHMTFEESVDEIVRMARREYGV